MFAFNIVTNLQHMQLNTKSISLKNLDFVFKYAVYKMLAKRRFSWKFEYFHVHVEIIVKNKFDLIRISCCWFQTSVYLSRYSTSLFFFPMKTIESLGCSLSAGKYGNFNNLVTE